jgi:GT2 family glycosyltransferase
MGELMQWADSDGGLCIVQHPFWSAIAAAVPGAAMLYDCMDHHAGFSDNAPELVQAEIRLIEHADVVVVTSEWLERELEQHNPHRVLIRNACDYAHFEKAPARLFADPRGRRIIGYYGAIAEWFDVDLVRAVARACPDALVLLVGADTAGVASRLADEPNVQFTGEVPYTKLPEYLHAFDVALLPFRVLPLTLATNPVKVYEYLSAGKPVVAVDLPELRQFGELVRCATDADAFVAQVREALREDDAPLRAQRRRFASDQTWSHRAGELDAALAAMPQPLVSVIVLTYNNLDFTKACLRSIAEDSGWPNLEVIVVDNASTDGTPAFLQAWAAEGPGRRVILNPENAGFSAGNNVGLAAARGDYLILLNNDTYVTPNWVRTLVNHLARHPDIGLVGPVTNNIGNEARIEIQYEDMGGMRRAAAAYTRRHIGELLDVRTAAFFCVAMRRSTFERVGPLDEAFGTGFFEDDDYCRRVEAEGLRVVVADDVFVHHHLSASFDALKAEKKQALFDRNKAIYEAKWGAWVAHAYRAEDRRPG